MARQGEPTRGRSRRGCLLVGALLVVPGAVIAWVLLTSMVIRECNPPRSIHRDAATATVQLDSLQPVAIQRVKIDISAEGMTSTTGNRAVRLQVLPATAAPSNAGSLPPLRVTFVDETTGQILANVHRGELPDLGLSLADPVELALDCPAGQPCSKDIRVVIALDDPAATTQPTPVTWMPGVDIRYEFVDCKGPPYGGTTIEAETPTLLPAADLASTKEVREAASGILLARHVTVSSGEAPTAAWLRTSVTRPSSMWLPWLVVLPDDGGPPVFDELLGSPFQDRQQVVDVPVLAACTPGQTCRAGYWILIRGVPLSGPYDTTWSVPDEFGSVELGVSAHALGRATLATGPVDIALEQDDAAVDLAGEPVALTSELTTPLEPDRPRAFDVHLSVPAGPAAPSGLDPRTSGYVVVRVDSPASGIGARLEGNGAQSLRAAVGGFSSLVAAPFTNCHPSEACEADLRIVAEYVSNPYHRIISPEPAIRAQVYLVGGPPGVTVTVDPVTDLPVSGSTGHGYLPAAIVALLAAGVVTIVVLRRLQARPRRSR